MKSIFTRSVVIILAISAASVGKAAQTPQMKADNQAINAACGDDAKAAGCPGAVVGKNLLRCLSHYKRTNAGFKFSDGCQAAMTKRKGDKAN